MKKLLAMATVVTLVLLSTTVLTEASSAQASVDLAVASQPPVSGVSDAALRTDLDFLFGIETGYTPYSPVCGTYLVWNASECNYQGCEDIGCGLDRRYVASEWLCECGWAF